MVEHSFGLHVIGMEACEVFWGGVGRDRYECRYYFVAQTRTIRSFCCSLLHPFSSSTVFAQPRTCRSTGHTNDVGETRRTRTQHTGHTKGAKHTKDTRTVVTSRRERIRGHQLLHWQLVSQDRPAGPL